MRTVDSFRSEYLGIPFEDKSIRIHDLAADEYDRLCDYFDGTICSRMNDRGVPMPQNSLEAGLINRHARSVRERMLVKYDMTAQQFQEALWRRRANGK